MTAARLIATLLPAALLLNGCASAPPRHARQDAPPHRADPAPPAVPLQVQAFELLGRRVVLTRATATTTAGQPLVVYLPGLGQPSEAGQRWHAAWAAAGYAVVSVQPLQADADAWRSELSRTGEFRELGRLHHGEGAQRERLGMLARLLDALRTTASTAQLDWHHAVLAGYDTGAQTVLDWPAGGWQPQGVIAISPPPMQPATRLPALVITSDVDGDPLGLIRDPAERRRGFDALAPGNAWLLSLPGVSHAGLSGTQVSEDWAAQDQHKALAMGGMARGRGGDGGRGPGGGAGVARGPRSGSATEAAQANLASGLTLSSAFLDARLRGAALPANAMLTAR
jgi:dienelactone hydrolase